MENNLYWEMARRKLSTDERWRIIKIGKWQSVNSLLMRDGEQLKWEMARCKLSTDERWRIIEMGTGKAYTLY